MNPELIAEQLLLIARQLTAAGQQGLEPVNWNALLMGVAHRLREQKISAGVNDGRELVLTLSVGNAVLSITISGRLHPFQPGPQNVPASPW
jgi:hypothetical protein